MICKNCKGTGSGGLVNGIPTCCTTCYGSGKVISKELQKERGLNVPFNINCRVEVELTDYGVMILEKHYHDLGINEFKFDGKDSKYRTEMWHLMQTFGACLWMGNRNIPFVRNEFMIVGE